VALRGGSGSGKTTLLNLVAGVLGADRGRILVQGEEITAYPEARRDRVRAEHVGYVFQTFNLLQGLTALENVLLPTMLVGAPDRARAAALLDRVGLSDRLDYRPRQLSVGQQQRVAVARALANRPSLVLADEPTGNLDDHHAGEALRLLREVCRENGAALLLVTHDTRVLEQFETVLELSAINRASSPPAPPPS
jgi:putative ABC transport system ATP-binding protein